MSESEVQKVPLLVEIIGEPSAGKTHLSTLFPKPALFDTTPKGEGYIIVKRMYPLEWKKRYFRVKVFGDFLTNLKYVKTKGDFFKTVVVDTSPDFRTLGAKAHLKELQKVKQRKNLMPEEWGPVNTKINEFITVITDPEKMCLNLVLTSQMQDEWVARKTTGRRIRRGLPTMNFQAGIRLFLQIKRKVDPKTMQYIAGFDRVCTVLKNRFRNQVDETDWKGALEDLTWKGIKELSKLEAREIVE